jgi:RNA polymerase sigma-70 factor (ECF subfamily)
MQRHLVELAMAGDHDAFAELARARIGRLYAVAVLILRDPGRAEDATQEALVAAWRDLSALRDPDRFDAWLRRLLVRACYRESRQARSHPTMAVTVASIEPSVSDDTHLIAERDEIERGFSRLDADQRAVIVLHYHVGLSMPEVADALGIPVGTAKSRLHRATRALRSALDADARGALPIEGWTA